MWAGVWLAPALTLARRERRKKGGRPGGWSFDTVGWLVERLERGLHGSALGLLCGVPLHSRHFLALALDWGHFVGNLSTDHPLNPRLFYVTVFHGPGRIQRPVSLLLHGRRDVHGGDLCEACQ
jgi:hypothetical protein